MPRDLKYIGGVGMLTLALIHLWLTVIFRELLYAYDVSLRIFRILQEAE